MTLAATGQLETAPGLIGLAAATSRLPDADLWLPLVKHRRETHTVLALIAVYAVFVALAGPMIGLLAATGYGSHIAADMVTRYGVPLLWPIWPRRLHLTPPGLRIITGSLAEYLLVLSVVAAVAVALYTNLGG
jgi:membrane-bound metal-dependent hydrolase YbcI (DUF457 family)